MSTAAPAAGDVRTSGSVGLTRWLRRNSWVVSLYVALAALFAFTVALKPGYGPTDFEFLTLAVISIVLAAAAQTVVVISGGIDLSIGPVMAFTSVCAAALMASTDDLGAVLVVAAILALGVGVGAVNGLLVHWSRVPDIVVTLAMSFVWAGAALLVLDSPGGAAAPWLMSLIDGSLLIDWVPRALVVMLVAIGLVWIPLRRSRLGLSMFAVGSDRLAALRSGVDVSRTKVAAYTVGGLLAAMGGLALTMKTGIGNPLPGPYTLDGIAALVLGGVSLAGGRGTMAGPIAAAFILALIRIDLVFLKVNPDVSTVVQGVILVAVVMVGALVELRRSRP